MLDRSPLTGADMTASSPLPCPSCGAAASGNFCAACGAPLSAQQCAACSTTLSPGARFCHKCGAAAPGTLRAPATGAAVGRSPAPPPDYHGMRPLPTRDRTAWVVAGSMILVTIAAVAYFATRRSEPTVPSMANAGNAVPGAADAGDGGTPAVRAPDISEHDSTGAIRASRCADRPGRGGRRLGDDHQFHADGARRLQQSPPR